MNILEIKGNTYCIDTGSTYIPFYKINSEDIIMLDTGLKNRERKIVDNSNNFSLIFFYEAFRK